MGVVSALGPVNNGETKGMSGNGGHAQIMLLTKSVAPEPESSSPHSQQPANSPYPEPGESTPHTPSQSP
jgi:hypothetical protein